jgi:hypothetical protein
MKKFIAASFLVILAACSATDKMVEHAVVMVAEDACKDAIALGADDSTLKEACATAAVLGPVANAIIDARANPAPVRARVMARRAAKAAMSKDAGAE